jgi:hypothetical protein
MKAEWRFASAGMKHGSHRRLSFDSAMPMPPQGALEDAPGVIGIFSRPPAHAIPAKEMPD